MNITSSHQLSASQKAFRQGIKDAIPSVVGVMPFGLIVGTASTAAGMDPWMALAMSIILYAGASQLAAIGLMVQQAPLLIVVATVLVVNLRFVMYSAAIAPYFRSLSKTKKWLLAYCLTDHLFALVTSRFKPTEPSSNIVAYYTAAAMLTWISWNSMIAIGLFAGTLVPRDWSLDFAIPLVFLALVFHALTSRAHWLTAGVAATAAIFTAGLPMKLGLIAAATTGVVIGTWLDMRNELRTSETNHGKDAR